MDEPQREHDRQGGRGVPLDPLEPPDRADGSHAGSGDESEEQSEPDESGSGEELERHAMWLRNRRRRVAITLARNLELGHPILQEAIVHADLSVRRAAIYGLLDTRTIWARRKFEEMQHNEQEWFVRSAATEALNKLNEPPSNRAPQPYPQPESQGWLVAWAATIGTGVPPGKAAIEVLNRALKEGDEATRLAAAEAIGRLADPALTRELYPILREPSPLLRDVAFRALARVSAASAQRLAAG